MERGASAERSFASLIEASDAVKVPQLRRYVFMNPDGGSLKEAFIHFDEHGLIVQSDGDGGDTAQRTGMFYYVHRDERAFERALDLLEVEPGVYVRHPFQHDFRNEPHRFSRDQQRPLVIALGKCGMHDRLWRLTRAHLMRMGKYQNVDVMGPSHLGEYVRAFRFKALYPLLWITDLGLLFSSLETAVTARFDADFTDDNNHLLSLLQAQDIMPTPISWLARKIYKNFRPENLGNSILGEPSPAQGALAWYHRAGNGGNPLIAEAYRPLVEGM